MGRVQMKRNETNAAPVRGLSHEDIEQFIADGWIRDPQSRFDNRRPLSVSELADFARENGLALYRDGVEINTPTPFLPPPPSEAELDDGETAEDEWFCELDVEERTPDGSSIPLFAEATESQTVLGIHWYSPWAAVYPPNDAEYWLAKPLWRVDDPVRPEYMAGKVLGVRYGNTDNWHEITVSGTSNGFPGARVRYARHETMHFADGTTEELNYDLEEGIDIFDTEDECLEAARDLQFTLVEDYNSGEQEFPFRDLVEAVQQ